MTLGAQVASTEVAIETLTALLGLALVVALVARKARFPYTLALAIVGLALGLTHVSPQIELQPDMVLFIFLPVLLFEGAWNMEMSALLANWVVVLALAVPGLLIAVAVAALALHFGAGFSPLDALLLSAIISPTDPIAVIALLRQLGLSSRLRVIIEGESLFNDGVGAVTFTVTLAAQLMLLQTGTGISSSQISNLVIQGVWLLIGGPLIGVALGYLASQALRHIEDRLIETAATFITAYGVYLLADLTHTSGLLAVVMAGLMMGSYGRRVGISDIARESVDNAWDFVSFVVTSLLFLVLGVQIGASLVSQALVPTLWATLGVLVGRTMIVYGVLVPYNVFAWWFRRRAGSARARGRPAPVPATWRPLIVLSGLRGALSLVLALSLPTALPNRDLMASVVYGVVLITLVGQGIGLRILLPRWPGLRDGERGHRPAASVSEPSAQAN